MLGFTKSETTQITFKLDEQYFRPLSAEAQGLGISPNIAAREHVIRGVTGDRSELAALRDELAAVRSELSQLRDFLVAASAARSAEPTQLIAEIRELGVQFATATAALLFELRPQASRKEIVRWVKKHLQRKAS